MIEYIKKRDGRIVKFNQERIANAIHKALIAVRGVDKLSKKLSDLVVQELNRRFAHKVPGVEQIQDIVENVLVDNKLEDVAKAYILYRARRARVREIKRFLGISDDLKLNINAIRVMERRYLLKDAKGHVIETPKDCFIRVCKAISKVDKRYGSNPKIAFNEFFEVMSNLYFLPNSPTLMNAGTSLGQLSACFVLPVYDSLESIFEAVKNTSLIQQSGGGTGFNFSHLRPRGDVVRSTGGIASGPVSFIHVFDMVTDVIKQGGRRRGANIGILNVNHPDIIEFINSKLKPGSLKNFNISVSVTDNFMNAVKKGRSFWLVNPRTKKKVRKLNARDIFNLIVDNAWRTGDPGLIFIDEINRHNPTPGIGRIESTNPCGEVPLLPYESCNLGSINLSKMVKNGKIDWELLGKVVRIGVHFLDNVIDANKYPLKEIEKMTKGNRKIGLGVMGFADMLIRLRVPYNSKKALKIAEQVIKFIKKEAIRASVELAKQRGNFPNFKGSIWEKKGYKYMRNATLLTIAPTGSISIIAGCSSGIEPLFAISFVRKVLEGTSLLEVNELFEREAIKKGFHSEDLMREIAQSGSLRNIKQIPKNIKKIFVTAFDIKPEDHIKMQAIFQKYVDNAVAKTINFPHDASVNDVKKAYLLAHKLKCKGITIYRYGSKPEQVLYFAKEKEYVTAESEYSGGCPEPRCLH